jgi:hypothetical protein
VHVHAWVGFEPAAYSSPSLLGHQMRCWDEARHGLILGIVSVETPEENAGMLLLAKRGHKGSTVTQLDQGALRLRRAWGARAKILTGVQNGLE